VSDPLIAARAVDLGDVGSRVLNFLAHRIEEGPLMPAGPVILLAEDLTPSDTAGLDPAFVLGFCTAGGGPTSHSAIIARALGIPAVVGAGPALLNQPEGGEAILDGNRGSLYVAPGPATLAAARAAQKTMKGLREAEKLRCYEPALMTDGHRVEVVANIGRAEEAAQAVNAGGEGVGLLRTEFLFLDRTSPPTEEEQFAAYCTMVRALNGLPLIIRTLDIGGDKAAPYLNMPAEDNPFLGVRGIRLCLAKPELFRSQLRAIYRSAQYGLVRIMFPMVSTLEELEAAKAIAAEVRWDLGAKPVDIGIMVEVPSAVMMAEEFAQEVDFFSIGTNDLTQYVLAMDRGHPILAKQADGLHPAVLRMVDRTVQAASAAGKWVGVCGGIAGDPRGAAILTGLGVTELSVSIPSIAAIKAQVRRLSLAQAQALARQAVACRTAAEVRSLPL
jgi:multiphosphoryl transfer protein